MCGSVGVGIALTTYSSTIGFIGLTGVRDVCDVHTHTYELFNFAHLYTRVGRVQNFHVHHDSDCVNSDGESCGVAGNRCHVHLVWNLRQSVCHPSKPPQSHYGRHGGSRAQHGHFCWALQPEVCRHDVIAQHAHSWTLADAGSHDAALGDHNTGRHKYRWLQTYVLKLVMQSTYVGTYVHTYVYVTTERFLAGVAELDSVITTVLATGMLVGGTIGFVLDNLLPGQTLFIKLVKCQPESFIRPLCLKSRLV